MLISQFVYDILEEQRQKVAALTVHQDLVDEAMNIAFYAAMIDAAVDDPDSPFDGQELREMLDFLETNVKKHVEKFQQLVNDQL